METLATYMDLVGNTIGFIGMFFALFAWLQARGLRDDIARERARQEQEIEIKLVLETENQEKTLPISIKRRELSRAEVLGRLGMMPMKEAGKRFALAYLSTPAFLDQIDLAQIASRPTTITIPCSNGEFEQFA